MIVLAIHFISLAGVFLFTLLHRLDVLGFKQAFLGLVFCIFLVAVTGIIKLVQIFPSLANASASALGASFFGLVFTGLCGFYIAKLITNPRLHDATTRTQPPVDFECVTNKRQKGDNPLSAAEKNPSEFVLVDSLDLDAPANQVFEKAKQLVEKASWEICDLASKESDAVMVLEATASTRFFGFKDDVRLEVQRTGENRSVVDMRSVSRVGQSDFGANKKRIETFLHELKNIVE